MPGSQRLDPVEVAFAGVTGQAALLADGRLTSMDLVELLLERIRRLDGPLRAFTVVLPEQARVAAAQADTARAAGDRRPLLGVPIAVKDNADVAGVPTRHGTGAPVASAPVDGPLTRRLRAAGLVVIGKTALPEYALWSSTESVSGGATRNPWSLDRSAGGSSGGSAAAVAAGLVAAAAATDGGGSIRIPAAACGLVGLKPQPGRVPIDPPEHWHGLTVGGFLTRTVADTAALLDAVADPPLAAAPGWSYAAAARPGRRRLVVAVAKRAPALTPVSATAKRAVAEAAALLRGLGHRTVDHEVAYGPLWPAFLPRYLSGLAADHAALGRPLEVERRTARLAAAGAAVPDALVDAAHRAGAALAARWERDFRDVDAVLTPTLAAPPPPVGSLAGRGALATLLANSRYAALTAPWNVTGQPAISLPIPPPLPGAPGVGGQLVGRPGDEATLLALAAELEAAVDWPSRRPPYAER